MIRIPSDMQDLPPGLPFFEGPFTRSVLRDLADLNRHYLELGLEPGANSDPLFGWSDDVRNQIAAAGAEVREQMAACPFALFELRLPTGKSVPGTDSPAELGSVQDRPNAGGHGTTRLARCLSFAHGALFTAWRLAESAPLVARIAFGLSTTEEQELSGTGPTGIALLAASPEVVGPRWPADSRFWTMLRGAAQAGSATSLQWAHCTGICLMYR